VIEFGQKLVKPNVYQAENQVILIFDNLSKNFAFINRL